MLSPVPQPSPLRQLLEDRAQAAGVPDVAREVAARLDAGQSLRHIARTLSTQTGVAVSREAIRRWYAASTSAAA